MSLLWKVLISISSYHTSWLPKVYSLHMIYLMVKLMLFTYLMPDSVNDVNFRNPDKGDNGIAPGVYNPGFGWWINCNPWIKHLQTFKIRGCGDPGIINPDRVWNPVRVLLISHDGTFNYFCKLMYKENSL